MEPNIGGQNIKTNTSVTLKERGKLCDTALALMDSMCAGDFIYAEKLCSQLHTNLKEKVEIEEKSKAERNPN